MLNIYRIEGNPLIAVLKGTYNDGLLKINNKEIKIDEEEIKQKFSRGYWRIGEI